MPSLVSHKLSIIKYVVLKKIFFLSLFWPSHLDLDLDLDSNLFGLGLDSDSNLFGLGLDSDSNLFGLGLVLDSTKVDLTTALVLSCVWMCVMTFLPLISVTCSLMALASFHTRVDMILLSLQGHLRGDVKASKSNSMDFQPVSISSKGTRCFLVQHHILVFLFVLFCAFWNVKISEGSMQSQWSKTVMLLKSGVTFGQVCRNLCSAFTHPKCTHTPWTHTRSSGQPFMLQHPGRQLRVWCLAQGHYVVLKVERVLYIHSPHLQSLLARTWTCNLSITSLTL